jgi:hypothetical protein
MSAYIVLTSTATLQLNASGYTSGSTQGVYSFDTIVIEDYAALRMGGQFLSGNVAFGPTVQAVNVTVDVHASINADGLVC